MERIKQRDRQIWGRIIGGDVVNIENNVRSGVNAYEIENESEKLVY